jgi:hypothetical protein
MSTNVVLMRLLCLLIVRLLLSLMFDEQQRTSVQVEHVENDTAEK